MRCRLTKKNLTNSTFDRSNASDVIHRRIFAIKLNFEVSSDEQTLSSLKKIGGRVMDVFAVVSDKFFKSQFENL